ncbi:MAG: ATP-binding protein [Humidesulfovibrio sp.]|nr:ATP-binding protein [Humidesulfovibrio sp.]
MRFGVFKRVVNSIKFRLLALFFTLYVVSFLALVSVSFVLLYNVLNQNEERFVKNELTEIRDRMDYGTLEQLISLCQGEVMENGFANLLFRVHTPARDVLVPSAKHWEGYSLLELNRLEKQDGTVSLVPHVKGGLPLRVGTAILPGGYVLQVGLVSDALKQLKTYFVLIFEVIFLPILLVGLGGGYLMARRSLLGITRVTQTAAAIYRGNLADRVERTRNGDEIDRLSETFNLMLARLELLITNMTEMVDNVAHDLRTPLTRLRGKLEVALMRDRTPAHYREVMESSLEDIELLGSLLSTVLNIAEAEAGTIVLNKTAVDLQKFLTTLYEFYAPMAEDSKVALLLDAPDSLWVEADANRLWQAVANLVDNAFKFTPDGGRIEISTLSLETEAAIRVADTGVGIAPSEQANIFRRFYRHGGGAAGKGYGLGLSLVKAVAEVHGGRVEVESTPGIGSLFSIILPTLQSEDAPQRAQGKPAEPGESTR